MKIAYIEKPYRLDLLIIKEFGVYNEYYKNVICYFNPRVDILSLKQGTRLLIPTREEISKIRRIRGYYNLVRE